MDNKLQFKCKKIMKGLTWLSSINCNDNYIMTI